jgi:hypothetical protein
MNRKIATVIVLACLLHLPHLAFCKQKGDADKKEERVEIKYLVPEANIEMVAKRLKLDFDHPTETRVICFYDTAALTLFTRTPKVILRSRYSTGSDQKPATLREGEGGKQRKRPQMRSIRLSARTVESCSLTDETQKVDEFKQPTRAAA